MPINYQMPHVILRIKK